MSWDAVDPDVREIFERVCTPRELEVVRLRFLLDERGGFLAWRRIGRQLDLDESTVRQTFLRAERKFLAAVRAAGDDLLG